MQKPATYCDYVNISAFGADPLHKIYHDNWYGFPLEDDNELFGRLLLEINQAGLSWLTILRKETGFRKAYHQFNIARISKYGQRDFDRLMNDAGIIRNRMKISAAIENARVVLQIQKDAGSFKNWLDGQPKMDKPEWTKLFRKTFRFTGGEIVNEFLMSTGYLPGAHASHCPVMKKIIKAKPAWAKTWSR